jgi:hypothetical protein
MPGIGYYPSGEHYKIGVFGYKKLKIFGEIYIFQIRLRTAFSAGLGNLDTGVSGFSA